ncbi:MAG: TatD family hydrolase [Candidatus Omnitrophota bacterium]
MLIDTHSHLDFDQFNADRDEVIDRAKRAGVRYIINIGADLESSKNSVGLASSNDNIFASCGIHPESADEAGEDAFAEIERLAKSDKVVAIGETGLDYYRKRTSPEKQKEVFKRFITLSRKLELPLVIHMRDASSDVLAILKDECISPVSGVMHCFSGDKRFLGDVLDLGLYVSFTCILTFKNATALREVARDVPRDRLLLETDAPFLAPQRYRGKRNEPSFLTELRDTLAGILDISADEVERITTENAKRLFKLPI